MGRSEFLSSQYSLKPFLGGATVVGDSPIERTYNKNQLIYTLGAQAAEVYVIVSGRVKVSLLSKQGREKILYLLGRGEAFGEFSLVSHERAEVATACELTRLKVFGAEQVRALIERDGQFALRFLQFLCQRIALLQKEIESHAFYSAKQRLMKTLLGLAEKFGTRNNGNVHIVNMTHETLGQLLGVHRETVSHLMPLLEAERFISYRRGCISMREKLLRRGTTSGQPMIDHQLLWEDFDAFGPSAIAVGAR